MMRQAAQDSVESRVRPSPEIRSATLLGSVAGVALFLGVLGAFAIQGMRHSGGMFVYSLDDAYIHLSIARNLAENGVWGISGDAFSGASSSVAWPVLIAALWKSGLFRGFEPLLLTALAGCALIIVANRLIATARPGRPAQALISCVLVLAFPLPSLALTGMEHVLHALLSVLLVSALSESLGDSARRLSWFAPALAALATATRYEAGFLVLVGAAALAGQKRLREAVMLAAAGALIPAIYGAVSVSHGGLVVPNSVFAKSAFPQSGAEAIAVLSQPFRALDEGATRMFLMHAAIFSLIVAWSARSSLSAGARWALGLTSFAILGHTMFGAFGWSLRYEAYLYALVLVFVIPSAFTLTRSLGARLSQPAWRLGLAAAALYGGVHAIKRSGKGALDGYYGPRNIFDQQIQVAGLAARGFPDEAVVANDIGALSYFARARILDLAGLGSLQVAELAKQGALDGKAIERLSSESGARVAFLYPHWFDGRLPESWVRVAELTIDHNRVCGAPTVAIYAFTRLEAPKVRRSLERAAEGVAATARFAWVDSGARK